MTDTARRLARLYRTLAFLTFALLVIAALFLSASINPVTYTQEFNVGILVSLTAGAFFTALALYTIGVGLDLLADIANNGTAFSEWFKSRQQK